MAHDIEETVCHTVTDDIMQKVNEQNAVFHENYNLYKEHTVNTIKDLQKSAADTADLKDRFSIFSSILMKKPDSSDLNRLFD